MTDKLYQILTAHGRLSAKLKREKETLQQIRETAWSASAIRYDADKVQSSPSDPMTRYAIMIEEQEVRVADIQDQLRRADNRVSDLFQALTEDQSNVMTELYVHRLSADRVKSKLAMSRASVYRYRSEALRILEAKLKTEIKRDKLRQA